MGKHPFPFYGQGEAGYYEWFEMWVWFESNVPKPKRAAVLRKAPRPCKRDAQWPKANLLWPSTGDQWIQQHLVEEYGTPAAKKRMKAATKRQMAEFSGEGDDDDGDDDWMDDLIAMGGETKTFNKDIETWLLAVHAKQPILFAARRQDFEAGGTKLGTWHADSVAKFATRVQPVLAKLATKAAMKPDDLRRSAISIVLEYVGADTLAPELRTLGRVE